MLRKRLVIPLAVAVTGTSVTIAGILRADAAETPAPAGCGVSYGVVAQWNTGFTADLQLRNAGSAPIGGWTLGFALPAGQQLDGGWSGHWSQSGTAVTVRDSGWNRTIAPGGTVSIGFSGSWRGSNPPPTAFTLNGLACHSGPAASPAPTIPPSTSRPAAPPSTSRPTTPPSTSRPATPSPAATTTTISAPAKGAENCAAGGSIAAGRYWLNNNQWGKESGSGTQCIWDGGGDAPAWGTSWKWTGQSNSVKSYASAVLGWHWGWKAQDTGLPIRLSEQKSVRTSWDFTVTQQTANTMNVSYDLWLHDIAAPDWPDQPADEVMVWLYRSGGAGPVGTRQATVTIGGTSWDLYRGDIGWNVFSFVRTGNTTSAELDLTDFTDDLTTRGWLPSSKYLSGVQAGTEIFTGEGALDTSAYAVTID